MLLENRTALVTGAGKEGRGIGRAIALALAGEGARVMVGSRTRENAELVAEAVNADAAVQAAGGSCLGVELDVTQPEQVEAAVSRLVGEWSRLDILVSNAGITRDTLLVRLKPADWSAVLDTNLTGAFHCTQAVARQMMRQKYGRIVYISSIVGIQGNRGQANYAAAKAGLAGLAKSTARELGSRGITVNVVAPGFIDTAMTGALPDSAREAITTQVPMERLGVPEDVAGAVLFLVGPHASYVTGEVLRVDGGLAM